MCFSPTASFVSGVVLTTVGIYSLRQVSSRSQLPFASIPLLFGIQQFVEGAVWLSFDSPMIHTLSTYMFVMFSHVLWPMFVPFAIWLLEKDPNRKRILAGIATIGALIAIYLFVRIWIGPVISSIVGHSIDYFIAVPFPLLSFLLYFVATCGGSLFSSSRKIRIFGTTTVLAFFAAHLLYPATLFSVWCFFSAALSIIIVLYMRDAKSIIEK